ncbi:recombinase family protein [Candidatus Dojkabacteria bacterium]|nr:recombinase family protein [Candidatus Dojkabacteria bacterium]
MKIYQLENLPKVTKMKYFYLIYCRKSTESEDRQVASIESQYNALRDTARQKGLEILQYFSESKSAKKPGREQFNKMVEMIKSRDDIKGVICWKLNRLSRNPQDSGLIRQIISDGTIEEIVTPDKTYLQADSDFTMAIEDAQSQRFIKDLRDDTARGINSKLEKGHAPILAPVGYINNKAMNQGEKTISPHPIYFDLMRKIFSLAMTGNYSLQVLTDKAKNMGIVNNLDRPISVKQMAKVVHNVFYTGRFVYGKILYQGSHIPMLTDDEFDLIQEMSSKKSRPRKIKHEHPLSGFIKCHYCGYGIVMEHKHKKSGWTKVYAKCANHYNNVLGYKCPQKMLPADNIETQVKSFLNSITLKPAFVEWAIKAVKDSEAEDRILRNKKYESLKRKHGEYVARLDILNENWLSEGNKDKSLISDHEYKVIKQQYLIEKTKIYRQLRDHDNNVDAWSDFVIDMFNFSLNVRNLWNTGDIENQKLILSIIGAKLVLKDDILRISPDAHFESLKQLTSHQSLEANSGSEEFLSLFLGG